MEPERIGKRIKLRCVFGEPFTEKKSQVGLFANSKLADSGQPLAFIPLLALINYFGY
jgi:hypothetical protein